MGAESNCTLYLVKFKVRPAPTHPTYYDWQCGILFVWMTGSAKEDVFGRAVEIVSHLPYEIIGEWRAAEQGSVDRKLESSRLQAMQVGIGISVGMLPLGEDEDWFEKVGE